MVKGIRITRKPGCSCNAVRHCSGSLFGSLYGTGSAFANNRILFQILFCALVVFGSDLVRACWSRCFVACFVRCGIGDSVLFDVLFGAACTSLAPVPALPRGSPVFCSMFCSVGSWALCFVCCFVREVILESMLCSRFCCRTECFVPGTEIQTKHGRSGNTVRATP